MVTKYKELSAENLKLELWDTLQEIRSNNVDPKTANAVASQARAIISTVRTQMQIQVSTEKLSRGLSDFAK